MPHPDVDPDNPGRPVASPTPAPESAPAGPAASRPPTDDHRPPSAKKGKKKKKAARAHADRREAIRPTDPLLIITFDGHPYEIVRAAATNVETFELIEDGKYVTAVRSWIGAEQWTIFKDAHRDPATNTVDMEHLEGFINAVMKAVPRLGGSGASSGR